MQTKTIKKTLSSKYVSIKKSKKKIKKTKVKKQMPSAFAALIKATSDLVNKAHTPNCEHCMHSNPGHNGGCVVKPFERVLKKILGLHSLTSESNALNRYATVGRQKFAETVGLEPADYDLNQFSDVAKAIVNNVQKDIFGV